MRRIFDRVILIPRAAITGDPGPPSRAGHGRRRSLTIRPPEGDCKETGRFDLARSLQRHEVSGMCHGCLSRTTDYPCREVPMKTLTKPFARLTAADLMSRDVTTVPCHLSLRQAAHLLAQARVTGAPVIDALGACVGVISATDFI